MSSRQLTPSHCPWPTKPIRFPESLLTSAQTPSVISQHSHKYFWSIPPEFPVEVLPHPHSWELSFPRIGNDWCALRRGSWSVVVTQFSELERLMPRRASQQPRCMRLHRCCGVFGGGAPWFCRRWRVQGRCSRLYSVNGEFNGMAWEYWGSKEWKRRTGEIRESGFAVSQNCVGRFGMTSDGGKGSETGAAEHCNGHDELPDPRRGWK